MLVVSCLEKHCKKYNVFQVINPTNKIGQALNYGVNPMEGGKSSNRNCVDIITKNYLNTILEWFLLLVLAKCRFEEVLLRPRHACYDALFEILSKNLLKTCKGHFSNSPSI